MTRLQDIALGVDPSTLTGKEIKQTEMTTLPK